MTVRRLNVLQWFGLFAGLVAVTGQHLLGFSVTQAVCSRAGAAHAGQNDAWQVALMVGAGLIVVLAGGAAVAVLARTQDWSYEDDPPIGRIRFFAIAALVTNVIFLSIVVLDGVSATASLGCPAR